ncbi:g7545 [Coccomyxa elongata]
MGDSGVEFGMSLKDLELLQQLQQVPLAANSDEAGPAACFMMMRLDQLEVDAGASGRCTICQMAGEVADRMPSSRHEEDWLGAMAFRGQSRYFPKRGSCLS